MSQVSELHPLTVAAMVAEAADTQGVHARYFREHPDALAAFGIDSSQVSESIIRLAARLDKMKNDILAEEVISTGGSWNGKRRQVPDRPSPDDTDIDPGIDANLNERMPATEKRKQVRVSVFGFSITSIIRTLAKEGWEFDDVWFLLSQEQVGAKDLAKTTARIQYAAGKKGERGPGAPLTKAQLNQLKKWCE